MAVQKELSLLKNSLLFQGLTEQELKNVYDIVLPHIVRFRKGDIVVSQGSQGERIGLMKRGTLMETKYNLDGDAQVVAIYRHGDVFGLETYFSQYSVAPSELSCLSHCEMGLIPYTRLLDPRLPGNIKEKLLLNAARILSDEQVELMSQLEVLSKRTLEKKILTYLNIIREEKGRDTFDIYMNQSQFAQFLCVNRSALSYELNRMRNEGIIDYDKSQYTILVDEDYGE